METRVQWRPLETVRERPAPRTPPVFQQIHARRVTTLPHTPPGRAMDTAELPGVVAEPQASAPPASSSRRLAQVRLRRGVMAGVMAAPRIDPAVRMAQLEAAAKAGVSGVASVAGVPGAPDPLLAGGGVGGDGDGGVGADGQINPAAVAAAALLAAGHGRDSASPAAARLWRHIDHALESGGGSQPAGEAEVDQEEEEEEEEEEHQQPSGTKRVAFADQEQAPLKPSPPLEGAPGPRRAGARKGKPQLPRTTSEHVVDPEQKAKFMVLMDFDYSPPGRQEGASDRGDDGGDAHDAEHAHDLVLKKGQIVDVISSHVPLLGKGWAIGREHALTDDNEEHTVGFFPLSHATRGEALAHQRVPGAWPTRLRTTRCLHSVVGTMPGRVVPPRPADGLSLTVEGWGGACMRACVHHSARARCAGSWGWPDWPPQYLSKEEVHRAATKVQARFRGRQVSLCLSRRGRSCPANASGLDHHRASITSRFGPRVRLAGERRLAVF
eukprot:COSAG01_NODE_1457_length_10252_cov_32.071400_6_plen_496_part_00